MKKEKKKQYKLQIEVDLKKSSDYHFVPSLSNVFFPYEPYEQQIHMVSTIQMAIKNKQNMLLQSPTGTGKTLCLLIGSLSAFVGQQCKKKIYYLTRTHTQISQVINQFKKTAYKCNINVIASREQLCVNYNICQLKGKLLEKACEQLCFQKLCTFNDNKHTKIPKPMQLNQFKQYCKRQLICPYFYTKQLVQKCEITILPFNYLLDWSLFEKNSLDLKDSVIIFDQAHNIDTLCEQGSDMRLGSDTLFQAINQLKALIKSQSKKLLHKQFKQLQQDCKQVEQIKEQLQKLQYHLKNDNQTLFLSKADFIEKLDNYTTTPNVQGIDLGNFDYFCNKGKRVLKLFFKKEMRCDNFQACIETIDKILTIVKEDHDFKKFSASIVKGQLLFRCLDPSLCFKRLVDSKPKTIILSSGTLGNLDIWEKNLQIPFQHKVTTQSFITSNQLYAQVKSRSQNGIAFNFSFQGKQSERQYEQLSKELSSLEKIIDGGIVVAFSNYDLLEKALKYSSILNKKLYFQTKGGNVEQTYKRFSEHAQNQGAILFIIMKGRFSQGINFTDKLCRCLLIVGIPFLPLKDAGVVQKMKYLQNNCTKEQAQSWYIQQSFRSLNQTIGRAIRNKKDHAVILLLDQRYLKNENLTHLSKWFTKCLRKSTNTYQQVKQFILSPKNNEEEDIKLQNRNSTKYKDQSKLCQRLLDFSTPSKSDRKKLKLILQSEQKQEKLLSALKPIIIVQQNQISHKHMNRDLADFFLQEQHLKYQKVGICNSNDKGDQAEETTCKFITRSYGKVRDTLDF